MPIDNNHSSIRIQNNVRLHPIIGDPIAHSFSPLIYNTLYERYHMPVCAFRMHILPSDLASFFDFFPKQVDLAAINVTVPHKAAVISYLDWVEEDAKIMKSVNSIAITPDGKRLGYSTDGEGFALSLAEYNQTLCDKRVLIIGAGGAAAAIAMQAIRDKASSITFLVRTPEKAEKTIANLRMHTYISIQVLPWSSLPEACETADIFVQCTTLGMEGSHADFESFSFLDVLPPSAFLCDIVYKPAKTALICEAEKRKIPTCGGIGMLIWQAFAAFDRYYQILPNTEDKIAIDTALREAGYVS